MKKQKVSAEILEDISVSDAKKVGRALYNYRLTLQWLQLRLERDWGITIQYSQLSEVIAGKRELGPKMRLAVYCAMKVIEQYEDFYGYKRKERSVPSDSDGANGEQNDGT